jgi:hypothetical protein
MKALFGMLVGLLFVLTCDAATINVPADYSTIQAAIDAAVPSDTIIIADGTYTGTGNRDIDFYGKAITLKSLNGPDSCIIDCQNQGDHRGFYFHSGESASSLVSGFTIKGGFTRFSGGKEGAGVYCQNSSPTFNNCKIVNNLIVSYNYSNVYGAGVYCSSSNALFVNCTIANNTANAGGQQPYNVPGYSAYGGGIYSSSGNPTFVNCVIKDNIAQGGQGADSGGLSNPLPTEGGNAYGGGICAVSSNLIIQNCLITGNKSYSGTGGNNSGAMDGFGVGGGIYNDSTATQIKNCTIAKNTASSSPLFGGGGGALYNRGTITNSIIWDNNSVEYPEICGTPTVSYSDIRYGYSGSHNINSNPFFVTGPQGDYYISQIASGQTINSPCINAGSSSAASLGMDLYTTQTTQKADAGIVDMGYHYSISTSTDKNSDFYLDFRDFAFFASDWLTTEPRSDFVPDGLIDANDLCVFAGSWLDCYVTQASNPNPADGTAIQSNYLTWSAGVEAASHDIYIGTDFNDVDCANRASNEFKGTVSNTRFDPCSIPVGLNYWRVDEVGPACTQKGNIWSFTAFVPTQSYNPNPQNDANNVSNASNLSWSPGLNSLSHDVYIGTDFNDVADANRSSPAFNANTTSTVYAPTLDPSTKYYWRVDEIGVSDTCTKGIVWNFETSADNMIGFISHWKFDEGSETIAHDSVGNNHGTVYGAVWTTGKIDGALSFDGIDDYVDCGSGPSNYDNITVSAWMKTSTEGILVSNRYSSYSFGTWYTLSSMDIAVGDNSQGGYRLLPFNTTTLDGNWHHVAYTKNGTSHAIYVDGLLDLSFTSNADISWNNPTFIGRRWTKSSSVGWFNGIIDDVRIYDRALSAEEVQQLYQSGL